MTHFFHSVGFVEISLETDSQNLCCVHSVYLWQITSYSSSSLEGPQQLMIVEVKTDHSIPQPRVLDTLHVYTDCSPKNKWKKYGGTRHLGGMVWV